MQSLWLSLLLGFILSASLNVYAWLAQDFVSVKTSLNNTYAVMIDNASERGDSITALYLAIAALIAQKASDFYNAVSRGLKNYCAELLPKSFNPKNKIIDNTKTKAGELLTILWLSLKVLLAKMLSILISFWVYLFATLTGVLDGLKDRAIRTMEGGRESTFVFHKVTNWLVQLPLFMVFIYIAMSLNINPAVITVILVVMMYGISRMACSQLKKYM